MSFNKRIIFTFILISSFIFVVFFSNRCFSATDNAATTTERYSTDKVIVEVVDASGEIKKIVVPPEYQSAQATCKTLIKSVDTYKSTKNKLDLQAAIKALDVSSINAVLQVDTGGELAVMLVQVLEYLNKIDPGKLPSNPSASPFTFYKSSNGEITIARQADGFWRFTSDTLSTLPAIWDALDQTHKASTKQTNPLPLESDILAKDLWIRRSLPVELKIPVLGLEIWQWILLFIVIVISLLIYKVIRYVVYPLVNQLINHFKFPIQSGIVLDIKRALSLFLSASFFWWGLSWLGLPELLQVIFVVAVKLIIWLSVVWILFLAIDSIAQNLLNRQPEGSSKVQDMIIPLLRKVTKVVLVFLALLFIADNLNIHITGLVAGVGIGGFAFAFIAKDAAENFVAGLTILLDNSFHVGDWIKVGSVEGTVVDIGIRTTRVRTFYDSVVFIPNNMLVKEPVDNLGRRTFRRFVSHFWLEPHTKAEKIEAFLEEARKLISEQSEIVKELSHINLVETTEYGYKIMLYLFYQTPDWDGELASREGTLLAINQMLKSFEINYSSVISGSKLNS